MTTTDPRDALPTGMRDRRPLARSKPRLIVKHGTWLHEDYQLTHGINVTVGKTSTHLTYAEAANLRSQIDRHLSRITDHNHDTTKPEAPVFTVRTVRRRRKDPSSALGIRLSTPATSVFLGRDDVERLTHQLQRAADHLDTTPTED